MIFPIPLWEKYLNLYTHSKDQFVPEIAKIFLKFSPLFAVIQTAHISASASLIVNVVNNQFLLFEVVMFYKVTTNTELVNTEPLLLKNTQD